MSGLIDTVPAELATDGPEWLVGLRRDAAEALREGGLPGKKHEAWRFTSVKDVVEAELAPVAGDEAAALACADATLGDDGTFRVVLANGRPLTTDKALASAPVGFRVRSLRGALAEDPGALEGTLGKIAAGPHFAAMNAAMFEDGLLIEVERGAAPATPVHLVHVATGQGACHPRVVIVAKEGSEATVVETFVDAGGEGPHLTNVVTEVDLRANAKLDHVRVSLGSERAMQIGRLAVREARDARYRSRVVALGGKLGRLDVGVRFEGPGAECELDGVYHVGGTDHVDHQVRVVHAAKHCQSHVRYRGLLDGKGHAVFDAQGIAERDASGTSAHQENRNLLLSPDARINTKPHLEIDTDDISASHGTTVGALDPRQSFYLRSRGVPMAQARDILTFAFVQELLERIPHAPTARRCSEAVLRRLPHGADMQEILS